MPTRKAYLARVIITSLIYTILQTKHTNDKYISNPKLTKVETASKIDRGYLLRQGKSEGIIISNGLIVSITITP